MNPNRSRKRARRPEALDLDLNRVRSSMPKTELKRGIEFSVQQSSGGNAEAGKTWMCPVCSISIEQGLTHTVAWDLHRGVETRRHFHNHCWKLFDGQLL